MNPKASKMLAFLKNGSGKKKAKKAPAKGGVIPNKYGNSPKKPVKKVNDFDEDDVV